MKLFCRVCGHSVREVISFGKMPLANGFLKKEEFASEYFFNLSAGVCEQCWMFQLMEQPEPSRMFHGAYPFFTGSSQRMRSHFQSFAEEIIRRFLNPQCFAVEIGSNDGTYLEFYKREGIRHLGVEPSSNTAAAAEKKGIPTWTDFFNPKTAEKIVSNHGLADAVTAANCLCHIPDLESVFKGLHTLLTPKGVVVFEDPYCGDVLKKNAYDQIYDEHVFLFSAISMCAAAERFGFEVFDLAPQWTHGGSMRFYLARKGVHPVEKRVGELLNKETSSGLNQFAAYEAFRIRCEKSRTALLRTLSDLKEQGLRVAGYAAASKSTTVLNYCGIHSGLIECIYDTTPEKQGKFTPGTHIPIAPYSDFSKNYPDAAVLFAWNHEQEILQKESFYKEKGGRWLLFVPEVKLV